MGKKKIAALLCLALTVTGSFGQPFTVQAEKEYEIRETTRREANERKEWNFNTNWLFYDGDQEAARESDFDDSASEQVSLPHSLGEYDLFNPDEKEWQKVTWYRRHFTVPEEEEGNRVFVCFDGGGQINKIYVNGAFVGTANGTFTHFSFDISDYITFGDFDNVIAVQVDSRYHYESLPPAENDFHWMGGLHGDARMVITDPLHLESAFYWTEKTGTEAYQEGDPVLLKGEAEITNDYNEACQLKLHTLVRDRDGREIANKETEISIEAGEGKKAQYEIRIENPNLWSPDHPYLYQVESWVEADGVRLDSETVKTGLRWMTSTGKTAKNTVLTQEDDRQILLNDQPIKLYGINKNMQFAYIGNSGTKKLQEKDAYTLKYDLGVNFVRTAHYENDPDFLAACDEIGLLVEEEALGWNTMAAEARPQFRRSVLEMVKRDRNHPSIVIWSIMPNEGTEANYPVEERQEIQEQVKALDPSRLTVQEEMYDNFQFIADVYANHDYVVSTDANPKKPIKRQPYLVGEWNDNLGRVFINPYDSEDRKIRQVTDDGKKLEAFMKDQTIDGIVKWDFNGYLTTINTFKPGKNIDIYRISGVYGPFKDPLVRYWEADMMRVQLGTAAVGNVVKIMNEWKADSPSTVYAAANAPYVELFLEDASGNRVSKGKIASNYLNGLWQGLFQWKDISWSEGSRLCAVSYDRDGKKLAEDIRYASSYEVPSDASYEITNVTSNPYDSDHYRTYGAVYQKENQILEADGSDLAVIAGVLRDKNGQKADYGYENTTFEIVSGPGRLITGPKTYMLGGVNSCYLQSEPGRTGDTVIRAKVDVGTMLNQDQFSYSASGWSTQRGKKFAYNGDFQKSSAKNAYVDITFTGTQAVLYAQLEYSNYGKGTVSVDGKADGTVNFQKGENKIGDMNFQPVYTTSELPYGTHTIRLQAQSSAAVTVDAAKIFDGKTDLVSNDLTIQTRDLQETAVFSDPSLPKAPKKERITREDVESILTEAENYDLDLYEAKGSLQLHRAIRRANQVLALAAPGQEELRECRDLLNLGISHLKSSVKTISFDSISDNEGGMSGFYHYSKNANVWVIGDKDIYANKSRTAGDYISLTFEGQKIEAYGKKDSNHGMAAFYLDQEPAEEADQYADRDMFDVRMYESQALSKGTHKIKIQVTGRTTGNPSNACVGISYVKIYQGAGEKPEMDSLNQQIEEAGELRPEEYPDQKAALFREALEDAKFIAAHPFALQSDVDAAQEMLARAIKDLLWVEVQSVIVQPEQIHLEKGQTCQLQVKVSPENADNQEIDFTSSAPAIASVSEDGRITGLAEGRAEITVSSGENPQITAGAAVTVTVRKTEGGQQDTSRPPAVPGRPSGIKFQKVSASSLKISWQAVQNAESYIIYRKAPKEKSFQKAKEVKGTSLRDTGLKAGTLYSYQVAACRKQSGITITGALSAVQKGVTLPKKPVLSAKKNGKNRVSLKWKPLAGGDGIEIWKKTGKKSYQRIKTMGIKKKSYQVSKLKKGTSVRFRIRAYKKLGSKKYFGSYSREYKFSI